MNNQQRFFGITLKVVSLVLALLVVILGVTQTTTAETNISLLAIGLIALTLAHFLQPRIK